MMTSASYPVHVDATFDALRNSTTPSEVAAKRGKSVEDITS